MSSGAACAPPSIDGNIDDLISFASCVQGCGLVAVSNPGDICKTNPLIIPCATQTDCAGGKYFLNGFDLTRGVLAYDRASHDLFLGFRVAGVIGDSDGDGTPDNNQIVCPSGENITDPPGIGIGESYLWFIDTNCDGTPEYTVTASGSPSNPTIFVLDANGDPVPGASGMGKYAGHDLEVRVTGLTLPAIFSFFGFVGSTPDGLSEDRFAPIQCPPPTLAIAIDKAAGRSLICPGDTTHFFITVRNTGTGDMIVSLTDPLPAAFTYDDDLSGDFTIGSNVGGLITFNDLKIPVGEKRTVSFRVRASTKCVGPQDNTASAVGNFDPGQGCTAAIDPVRAVGTATVDIGDHIPPAITCPPDRQLQCGSATDPGSTGSATATDNCTAQVAVTFKDASTAPNCTGVAGIDRTWTATDGCGNTATCLQHITFVDTTPPVIACPPDKVLQCGDPTDPGHTGSATAGDNCTAPVAITFADVATPSNCTGVPGINRTWTATDGCGNTATCVQHITFIDTTPPTITCPPDKQLQCGDPTGPSSTGSATATDNCAAPVTIAFADAQTAASCTGVPGIDRTWTATDGCGNTATCVQHIIFVDTTPPTITCPPDKQLQCGDPFDPGHTGGATATDNCAAKVAIAFSDVAGPAGCTGVASIDRTWTATDGCGNTASCVQHLTFVNTTPPTITCPPDRQLQCGASTDPSSTGSATATDNCPGPVTITFGDAPRAANCTGVPGIDRTWKATDGCGNTATCVQHLTFVDTTPPTITCPPDKQLECGASTDPTSTGSATATDNCAAPVTVTFGDAPTAANCTGAPGIARTWTATDGCGNTATCVQHLTFVDTTPPTITCPPDKQLQCGASTDPSSTGLATATDNCAAPVTVTFGDAPTAANCTGVPGIDRTWKATDGCGNTATCVQHLTFVDTTPPTISCPPDKQLQCGASTNPGSTGSATATDNCAAPVTIGFADAPTKASCTGVPGIDRTWTATDGCGNTATCLQHITFVDTTPPTITCPPDKQLQCGSATDPGSTGSATATDNCAAPVTITFADAGTPANCTGVPGIDRTWTATDGCGNTATCVQHIIFVDTKPPVIACPPDKQLQCGDPTDPSHTGSATAGDNCAAPVTITFADAGTAANCTGVAGIDRTWKATDGCGNSATCVQHITFVDTTAPTITCPPDRQIQCGDPTDPGHTGSATATDNCAAPVTLTFADIVPTAGCSGLAGIDRTWTATDGCGNTATCVQHIILTDTTPPTITCPPDKQLQCGDPTDPSHTGSATGSDNCAAKVGIDFTDAATPAGCTGLAGIDRTWKATDGCGNTATCVQHIIFVDTTAPAITCPPDRDLQCGDPTDPSHTGSATASDNCGASVTIDFTDAGTPAGCTGLAGIDRTWKATDGCGNTATCVQHLIFVDTTAPGITCPPDKQLNCGDPTDPRSTGTATATDNCGGTVTIGFTDTGTPPGCTGVPGIDRTWKATDGCGNTATCVQHIIFVDTTAPAITCPPDRDLQCGESTDPSHTGTPTATDNCGGAGAGKFASVPEGPGGAVTFEFTDTPTAPGCSGVPGIDRTWKATDRCGNTATCLQYLRFVDTTPPVITCPPDKNLQCGDPTDPGHTGSATATDNCPAPVTIGFTDAGTPAGCTGLPGIDRTWKATDGCGNTATCVQHIIFVDTTAPTITCPADQQLQCGESTDPSHTGSATATDNCSAAVTIGFTDAATHAGCTGLAGIDRTWKATDGCGNTATCVQHLIFVDTTPPTITCPVDKQLQCGASTEPGNTGSATATDNCGRPTISFADTPTPANCTGRPGIDRTWKAADGCGNTATCVQHIIFVDTTPPVIACPRDRQLQCGEATDPAHTGSATAGDNCSARVAITFADTPTPAGCTGLAGIDRTWTATDGCGNTSTCVQHITFVDTTPPVISCPGNITVGCDQPVVTFNSSATDNCGAPVTVTCNPPSGTTFPVGRTTVTCTAHDPCGNQAACSFVVTVNPCGSICRITGGGCLNEKGGNSGHKQNTFGGNVSPLHTGGGPTGNEWEHVIRQGSAILFNFHSHDAHITQCTVVPPGPCHPPAINTRADFEGTGLYSLGAGTRSQPANFKAYIIDHGEGKCGGRDYYTITVRSGLVQGQGNVVFSIAGTSDCGNLQVHETPASIFGPVTNPIPELGAGDPGSGSGAGTDVGDEAEFLNRVIPNPFSSTMSYSYRVPEGGDQPVDVNIYDMAGRRVRSLASGTQSPGLYTVQWDGRSDAGLQVAPGAYFLRARVSGVQQVTRVVYLKQ